MVYSLGTAYGRSITVNTEDGLGITGIKNGGKDAAGLLIRLTLNAHGSVVVYSKETDYYPYIKDTDIRFTDYFTAKKLFEELKYPFLSDLTASAVNGMKRVMEEAGQGRDLVYLKGEAHGSRPYLSTPGLGQCFYQIRDAGTKKDRILCEAVFTALLIDACTDRMREPVFFYEAPYKPSTKAAMDAVKRADSEGVALIGMYKNSAGLYKSGRYIFGADSKGIYVRDGKKRIRIKE